MKHQQLSQTRVQAAYGSHLALSAFQKKTHVAVGTCLSASSIGPSCEDLVDHENDDFTLKGLFKTITSIYIQTFSLSQTFSMQYLSHSHFLPASRTTLCLQNAYSGHLYKSNHVLFVLLCMYSFS